MTKVKTREARVRAKWEDPRLKKTTYSTHNESYFRKSIANIGMWKCVSVEFREVVHILD